MRCDKKGAVAICLHSNQTALGDYFWRMKARLGTPAAITALHDARCRLTPKLCTRWRKHALLRFNVFHKFKVHPVGLVWPLEAAALSRKLRG